ncbi:MAG: helix-turn-helix domain-containing protein [Ilumatobacteraceae bacterium]
MSGVIEGDNATLDHSLDRSRRTAIEGRTSIDRLGVELVHWPRDEALRANLARAGIARLLLVEIGAQGPETVGIDEDWVRLPADEREIWTRAERLSRIASELDLEPPILRPGRILTHGPGAVVLSRKEALVVQLLLDPIGSVVTREALTDRLWPAGPPASGYALDALVARVRRRLATVHVCIRSVRTKGYVIHVEGP